MQANVRPRRGEAPMYASPSLARSRKHLMRVRMGRVLHPDAWSRNRCGGTNHVVSNVIIENEWPNGDVIARSRFHMMELRRDDVRHFAGSYMHKLKKTAESYRIKLQRVDMTNEFRQIICTPALDEGYNKGCLSQQPCFARAATDGRSSESLASRNAK
jgi:3-phenylpropionate/cinnamic acid dioxygenase small subunit